LYSYARIFESLFASSKKSISKIYSYLFHFHPYAGNIAEQGIEVEKTGAKIGCHGVGSGEN
jgi:hypothetical protein